ncbi:MAG: succinylglutamate desuccinylase/aspartoacylase family protein [Eubacterium sp.]|nr:succinylglutamate desuccinylase/aspartoacylase family protein [Eubacterium sp.]SEF52119.1 hypothetical protein SAMN04487934_101443 [Eubacterium ruminantium]
MIDTVVSVNLMVGETLKIKKNRLGTDYPRKDDKRLCIVSGIYGDELQGQYICYETIRRIKNNYENLTGIVDIYPSLNPMGLEAGVREIPGPELNMNELFPGSESGAMGEYAAYAVVKDIEGADFCLDVHGSDMYLNEIPQIRMNDDVEDIIMPYAEHLNTDMIWVHPSTQVKKGSLVYELNKIGVKSCVTESCYAYKINQKYCNQIVDGIFSLMKYMGIWKGLTTKPRDPFVVHDDEVVYINSESSGIFIPNTSVHDMINENDEIGRVVDVITGSVEEVITAPARGIITGMRQYPAIEEGSLLARIVRLDEERFQKMKESRM